MIAMANRVGPSAMSATSAGTERSLPCQVTAVLKTRVSPHFKLWKHIQQGTRRGPSSQYSEVHPGLHPGIKGSFTDRGQELSRKIKIHLIFCF